MVEEKRDDAMGDPMKLLLEEALTRQWNEMMDNFAQIHYMFLTTSNVSTSNSHSWSMPSFKVQVNFYIPIFEGQINADSF